MRFMPRKLLDEYEKRSFKNKFRRTFCMGCEADIKHLILEDQKDYIRGCEWLKYLGVKVDEEGREDNYIKNRYYKARAITAMSNALLSNSK